MTSAPTALLTEAGRALECAARKFWSVDTRKNPFCSLCQTDYPHHTGDCLITRLRQAASQKAVMPERLRKVIDAALDGAFHDAASISSQPEKWDEQRAFYVDEIAAEYSKGTGS